MLRYWWVVVKLAITVVLTVGSNLVVLWRLRAGAAAAGAGAPLSTSDLRIFSVTSTTAGSVLIVIATVLSILKPWGRTRDAAGPRPLTAGNPRRS